MDCCNLLYFYCCNVVAVVVDILFYFVLLEQDPLLNDWVVFDKCDLVLRVGYILSCRVEKSGPGRGEQFDRNGFALATGHRQRYRGMHACVVLCLVVSVV